MLLVLTPTLGASFVFGAIPRSGRAVIKKERELIIIRPLFAAQACAPASPRALTRKLGSSNCFKLSMGLIDQNSPPSPKMAVVQVAHSLPPAFLTAGSVSFFWNSRYSFAISGLTRVTVTQ